MKFAEMRASALYPSLGLCTAVKIAASNQEMTLGKIKKIFVAVVFAAALSCAAQAQQYDAAAEQWMVKAVNSERAKKGLAALEVDERLTQIARKHSERMAAEGDISHQFNGEPSVRNRVNSTGMRFNYSGENVAFDSSIESAHRGLLTSPHHYENIMKKEFNVIGIGVVRSGSRLYVTQNFARRLPEVSVNDAEEVIAKSFAQLRRQTGAGPLRRVAQPELRSAACEMARLDSLSPRRVPQPKGTQNVVVWTATELEELPGTLKRLGSTRASGYSLGACLASSRSYPNPVYWVALVTYY